MRVAARSTSLTLPAKQSLRKPRSLRTDVHSYEPEMDMVFGNSDWQIVC